MINTAATESELSGGQTKPFHIAQNYIEDEEEGAQMARPIQMFLQSEPTSPSTAGCIEVIKMDGSPKLEAQHVEVNEVMDVITPSAFILNP